MRFHVIARFEHYLLREFRGRFNQIRAMMKLLAKPVASTMAVCAAGLLWSGAAQAHPHVWSDMRSDLVLDDQGRAVAINVEWIFDEGYTQAAIEGMDADGDGIYTPAELHPVATENINALKEFRYFVQAQANSKDVPYADVTEYGQRINDQGRLHMIFVVPFASPVDLTATQFNYSIYDPDFFIAYEFVKENPVAAIGDLPKGCTISVGTVAFDEQVEQTKNMLADKPVDWQPEQPTDFGAMFAQPVSVTCKPPAS
jgi:ABC-type uncharacterized transport system substrate-binding protein